MIQENWKTSTQMSTSSPSARRSAYGLGTATALAAKATNRRRWTAALAKYWVSLRTCSVPAIEHHPRYGTQFSIENDPINHAVMAQAITTAFSVLEELDLHAKSKERN